MNAVEFARFRGSKDGYGLKTWCRFERTVYVSIASSVSIGAVRWLSSSKSKMSVAPCLIAYR